MNHAAKRCVQWAIGLWVLGALVLIYGAQVFVGLTDLAGANAATGLDVVNIVLTILRSALFPTGAALVGAAVVVQALTGRGAPRREEVEDGSTAQGGRPG